MEYIVGLYWVHIACLLNVCCIYAASKIKLCGISYAFLLHLSCNYVEIMLELWLRLRGMYAATTLNMCSILSA